MMMIEKLLSHRLRGFGSPENTAGAMRAACGVGIRYLEIDTRVSPDGTIYVRHNPWSSLPRSMRAVPSGVRASKDSSPRERGSLFPLEEALRLFSDCSNASQRLCIDIKDYGFEHLHLELVRRAGLEQRVSFVSWIPQTILRLHLLGTTSPLVLSYVDLVRFGWLGRAADRAIAGCCAPFGWFVILGRNRCTEAPGSFARGYQHGLICVGLPAALVDVLSNSRGGICVQRRLVNGKLIARCLDLGLELWTFSVRTKASFVRYARQPGVKVVFCDRAEEIARALNQPDISGSGRDST
jgi:glycerophosphoryl diester phosphodiesterase